MIKKKTKITSIEVADLAGVSQSTVSRSFSPSSPVAKKTREKVKKIADMIGYQPNAMARSLITQKSNMVGIVISNVTINPFYPEDRSIGRVKKSIYEFFKKTNKMKQLGF